MCITCQKKYEMQDYLCQKNNIQTLYYFTVDKTIDISRLSKLEVFQTLKSVKAKVKSSWIRKTFRKNKWGCAIVKSGKFIKKIKAGKKKIYTYHHLNSTMGILVAEITHFKGRYEYCEEDKNLHIIRDVYMYLIFLLGIQELTGSSQCRWKCAD